MLKGIVGINQKSYGFREIRTSNQPSNRLVSEKPTGMHWLGRNDAVP